VERHLKSKALRRDQRYLLYTPARFNTVLRYPLLVVHDGPEYVQFAAMKTVLDNLIHRLDIAPMIVAFVPPGDRLREYANHAPHARFLARELLPELERPIRWSSPRPGGA
jgi:enterochelin esterase-like enzyme